jgi:hypothetical protein
MLTDRAQISLAEVLEQFPLQQGIAELVTYLFIATRDTKASIADTTTQIIWCPAPASVEGGKHVTLPLVIFCR